MAVKKRNRANRTKSEEFEKFVAEGGTVAPPPTEEPEPSPAPAAKKPAKSVKSTKPMWMQREETAKKTEAQLFRYNRSQQRLLEHAKAVEGRDYSKILASLVWPALEEKYGKDVPLTED